MSVLERFDESLKNLCEQFTKTEDKYDVVVAGENYPQFQNLLKRNAMTFIVRHSEIYSAVKRRLLWKSCRIPFFNTPFCIEKVSQMQCSNGPNYYSEKSSKKMAESVLQHSNSMDESDGKPILKRRKKQSKKVGCSAAMRIIMIRTFSDYSIKKLKNIKDEKARIMKDLKKKLEEDPESVSFKTLYYVLFSTASVHCHSVSTNFTGQQLDPALRAEIRSLVESGITNHQTIEVLLCKWVKENIGDVSNSSRAYCPTKKTIRNYVSKFAPHLKTPRAKVANPGLKKKNASRKKRPIEKKSDYPPYDLTLEVCDSPPEICASSSEIPVFSYNEHDYQYQITCPATATFDSAEKPILSSEIRGLIRIIYDRSVLLPDDCTDSSLRDKLLDIIHLMNNYIDDRSILPS